MSKKVKKSTTRTFVPDQENFISAVTEYDVNGNVILEEEYSEPDRLLNRSISVFNDQSQLLETKDFVEDGELAHQRVYQRDAEGKLLTTEVHYPDGSCSYIYSEKDPTNHVQVIKEEDEEGELESKEIDHLNDKGNVVSKELYDFNNKLTEAYRYSYDEADRLIKREELDKRKKLILYTLYEYDEQGHTVLRANYNRKGKLSDYLKIEYNDQGQVIKQEFSGKLYFIFEYDAAGNTILEERYQAGGDLLSQSRFEYDEEGNLTKEITPEYTKETHYEFY